MIIPHCCALAAAASDGAQMTDGFTSAIVGVQKASTARPRPGMGLRARCGVASLT